jgi:dimethylglycine dehydrogenase
MKDTARVVVIGGGVVGCSMLYHLAKKGWTDSVLVERTELTAGSTWHAAGLLPLFNMSYSVGQLHKYSLKLYGGLEEETGQSVGLAKVGNLRLATNQDRMDEYHHYAGTAATIGVNVEFKTPEEIQEMVPFANVEGLVGGILHPDDGYIQSADVTMAMAKGARDMGATIYQQTPVIAIERTSGGEWLVKTEKGDIRCEHVVSATGNYARQTGRMVGLDIPVVPVQHQFIVTEAHPLLEERKAKGLPEMPVFRESDAQYYLREERQGLILGPYEVGAPAVFLDGVTPGFEKDLFPADLDRDLRRGRHQGRDQRTDRLYAGRQPDRRPGTGAEKFLAQRRPQFRHHRGRRRRLAARRMDHRGPADRRHAGRRPAALRRLCLAGLPQDQERGSLQPRLHHPFP